MAWFEQVRRDGQITFIQHTIMEDRSAEAKNGAAFSQPHAIDVADIDGDGLVGKRRWANAAYFGTALMSGQALASGFSLENVIPIHRWLAPLHSK